MKEWREWLLPLILFLLSLIAVSIYWDMVFDADIDNDKISVLESNGAYTCKFGTSFASREFPTYEEAEEYCVEWKGRFDKTMEFRNREWTEVVE